MRLRLPFRLGRRAAMVAAAGLALVGRPCIARPEGTVLPPPRPASLQADAPGSPGLSASDPQIGACLRALTAQPGNRIRPAVLNPQSEDCRVADPVVVEALAVRTPAGPGEVRLVPPPTISCELARAVSLWLDTSLQPLARGAFGRELAALRVGGGHECRRRNREAEGLPSEHATGRALDIFAFELAGEGRGAAVVAVARPNGLEETRFVDAARQSGCGAFATVLGPGADSSHADHLHVDIQQRRAAASRFCQ